MRIFLLLAMLSVLPGVPALAATDDSIAQSTPPTQGEHECERRRDTPTS